MTTTTRNLIARIGETDQQFLQGNTPELALERGRLRLDLVNLSQHRQEQIHFLQEALVIFEQGRVEFEEMPMSLYLDLSIELAKAYMTYFKISGEARFALITQQILKPLAHHHHADVYLYLAHASVVKDEIAMTQHWLKKYFAQDLAKLEHVMQIPAFDRVKQLDWFKAMMNPHLH